jgi:hypothetical protein
LMNCGVPQFRNSVVAKNKPAAPCGTRRRRLESLPIQDLRTSLYPSASGEIHAARACGRASRVADAFS